MRAVQVALGLSQEFASGIPNEATRMAFDRLWMESLAEYRKGQEDGTAAPQEPGKLKVGADYFIEGVKRDIIAGGSPLTPVCIVIHFTAGATGKSSIDYWKERGDGVCAHLVIERDGAITQCRPFNKQCGHAGVSRWKNPATGKIVTGLNAYAIGIELANAGDDEGALKWARKQGFETVVLKHANGGITRPWETYPEAQIASCLDACRAMIAATPGIVDITGHDNIAPERKSDPGPAFPMEMLRRVCGFKGAPETRYP